MSRYQITYIDPKITLLDQIPIETGYEAWLRSRKSQISVEGGLVHAGAETVPASEYRDRIFGMNLQYMNIPTFVFEIQGSVLFRDILYNLNNTGDWATSHRFEFSALDGFDPAYYPVSSEYRGIAEWEEQFDRYMDKVHETDVTDENRSEMPYSLSSLYWISMSWKTLIGFVSMLKLRMPFFYEVYGKLFEECMGWKGVPISDRLVPFIDISIQQYFRSKPDEQFRESFDTVGDTVVMNKSMGLLLFSQFLRQQGACIKGLYDQMVHSNPDAFSHKVFYGSTQIDVSYTADISRFMGTIMNRLCWFSMSGGNGLNSWSPILNILLQYMDLDKFMKMVPCKVSEGHVKCRFRDDIKFRKEGRENRGNLPCGIALMDSELCRQRHEQDRTILSEFYVEFEKRLEAEGVKPIV